MRKNRGLSGAAGPDMTKDRVWSKASTFSQQHSHNISKASAITLSQGTVRRLATHRCPASYRDFWPKLISSRAV